MIVSVEEYRKMLNDYISTEERIQARVEYLEAFCRNIARLELEAYVKACKAHKKEQLAVS